MMGGLGTRARFGRTSGAGASSERRARWLGRSRSDGTQARGARCKSEKTVKGWS